MLTWILSRLIHGRSTRQPISDPGSPSGIRAPEGYHWETSHGLDGSDAAHWVLRRDETL